MSAARSAAPAAAGRSAPTASPATSAPTGLTVRDVVHPGAVVGVDDSELVHALLADVVATGPSVVGTASLVALTALTGTPAARTGALRVRLFGGEFLRPAETCTGTQTARAVIASGCDVALIGGQVIGADVWVPAAVVESRLALLLAARRAYVVLAAAGDRPDPVAGESRLAALTAFDGALEVPDSVSDTERPAVA